MGVQKPLKNCSLKLQVFQGIWKLESSVQNLFFLDMGSISTILKAYFVQVARSLEVEALEGYWLESIYEK